MKKRIRNLDLHNAHIVVASHQRRLILTNVVDRRKHVSLGRLDGQLIILNFVIVILAMYSYDEIELIGEYFKKDEEGVDDYISNYFR